MNKRKIPSLPTKEDRLIWLRINLPLLRPHSRIMPSAAYHEADRRDAEQMLGLVLDKRAFGRFMWPESLWEQYIADGGDGLSEWT
jgi:hypothetical protein